MDWKLIFNVGIFILKCLPCAPRINCFCHEGILFYWLRIHINFG